MPPFDPYHKWLGIPPAEQPPSHYRLLGLAPMEDDGDVIAAAADQRMDYLHQFAQGEHGKDAQRLMDEIARASMCLLDPVRRTAYDATLHSEAKTIAPSTPTSSSFQSAPTAMFSKPVASVVIDDADAAYRPKGKDRGVLYFWLWNSALFVAIVVLAVIIGLRGRRGNDDVADSDPAPANVPDDADSAGGSFLTDTEAAADTSERLANVATTPANAGTAPGGRQSREPVPRTSSSGTQSTPMIASDTTEEFPIHPPDSAILADPDQAVGPPATAYPLGLTLPADETAVQQCRAEWSAALGWDTETVNTIEMPLVLIPPGEFLMGDWSGNGRTAQTQQVSISSPFYMGRHEVTQQEWRKVMGDETRPSYYSYLGEGSAAVTGLGTTRFPVESVTWLDAISFCNALSQLEALDPYYNLEVESGPDGSTTHRVVISGGTGYRLPTEAEWEYACRAGTITAFGFGDVDAATAESFNSLIAGVSRITESESYPPNAFGLYDMHGNAWEWCYDWFDQFQLTDEFPLVDPVGPETSVYSARLIRGGSYVSEPDRCMSISRAYASPDEFRRDIGFRVVRTLEAVEHVDSAEPAEIADSGNDLPSNLLDEVHPELHSDSRPWERTSDGIVADNLSGASFLTVPGFVPEEYDLHIRLTIEREEADPGSDVHISLPQSRGARGGRTAFPFVIRRIGGDTLLSFWPADPTSGEFGITPLGVTLTGENPFSAGATITFQVRDQRITVLLNDDEQFVFRNFGRAITSEIALLKLGSWQNRVIFHSVQLTPFERPED